MLDYGKLCFKYNKYDAFIVMNMVGYAAKHK